jgi:diaminohydroxyphosphoribosylaminopyrimidine deaminase/5-amino-6-(5-phosphoribosylamino)uracil reductase
VAGKGIQILENAGIEVKAGVLENECLEINSAFFTFMQKKRPFIILKWAETADGFVARENFDSKWISNPLSRQMVHKWRTELDAILVGKNTVQYDDPQLTARDWSGKNPVRLVIDHQLALSDKLKIFDKEQKTILFHTKAEKRNLNGVDSIQLGHENFLKEMMTFLFEQKIQSVLVEGGAQTLQSFIEADLWDEARIFKAAVNFEKGIKSPQLNNHKLVFQKNIMDSNQKDVLSIYQNK